MAGDNTDLNDDLSIGSLTDDLEISMEDFTNPTDTTSSLADSLDDDLTIQKNKPSEDGNANPENVAVGDNGKPQDLDKPSGSSSPGDLSQYYSSFADHLVKEGVLPDLNLKENKVENIDQLQEAIQNQINSKISDSQKAFEKAMQDGVPKDAFSQYQRTKSQLDSITTEMITSEDDRSINLRKNIIGQDFLNRGFTKEEAIKYAQRSIDLGEDVADASSAIERLKTFNNESFEKSRLEAEQEKDKVHTDIKQFIETTPEILKGLKLSKNVKDKLYDQIIKPAGTNENGDTVNAYTEAYSKEPVKFQVMQNYLYMITKGFTDFSKLTDVATTNASRGLDDLMKNTNPAFFQTSGNGLGLEDTESKFTLGDGLMLDS